MALDTAALHATVAEQRWLLPSWSDLRTIAWQDGVDGPFSAGTCWNEVDTW